jgi:SAM-dependent methyltransferase
MGDKRAEIEFLRRSGSLDWELRKPFSPPRQWTCPNSIDLIEKFVVGMRQLNACPEDTILDLGAGACWASEWLQGLNIRTISLDISVDAIRAGRDRVHDKSLLVVGDMASLPLRDAVCTKVLSLDALHHSQDVARSVREVHRVLKPGGCAVFVEPGMGHSDAPETRTSIDDFGLTERSIQINEMFELCATAGFAEVRLKPISYIIPEFEMTQQDWIHWERFWMRKRPVRAIQKIGRRLCFWKRHLRSTCFVCSRILFNAILCSPLGRHIARRVTNESTARSSSASWVRIMARQVSKLYSSSLSRIRATGCGPNRTPAAWAESRSAFNSWMTKRGCWRKITFAIASANQSRPGKRRESKFASHCQRSEGCTF